MSDSTNIPHLIVLRNEAPVYYVTIVGTDGIQYKTGLPAEFCFALDYSSTPSRIRYAFALFAHIRLLKYNIEQARFDNFCGLPCARLSRNQSVRGEKRKESSKLFSVVSILFFQVPKKYIRLLDGLYMDKVVFQAPFQIFVSKTTGNWQLDVVNVRKVSSISIPDLSEN